MNRNENRCPSCLDSTRPRVRFCHHCGAALIRIEEIRKRRRRTMLEWSEAKGVVLFYLFILGSVLPL